MCVITKTINETKTHLFSCINEMCRIIKFEEILK